MFKKHKKRKDTAFEAQILSIIKSKYPPYIKDLDLIDENFKHKPRKAKQTLLTLDECKSNGYITDDLSLKLTKEGHHRLDDLNRVKSTNIKAWIGIIMSGISLLLSLYNFFSNLLG